jgi:5-methylcytosine-specific restriction endonuclease McrA
MLDEKFLHQRFEVRWKNLETRSNTKNLTLPDKQLLWYKVLHCFNTGFYCEYCGQKMLITDPTPPHHRSFSLEHKTSLDAGGDNKDNNFAVVCTRCNIIKGTMTEETFRAFLTPLLENQSLLDKVFREMWNGRFANKMERTNKKVSFIDNHTQKQVTYNLPSDSTLPGCIGCYGKPLQLNQSCDDCRDNIFCKEVPTNLGDLEIEVWNEGANNPYYSLLSKDWPKCLGSADGTERQGLYCEKTRCKCPHIELCGYIYRT